MIYIDFSALSLTTSALYTMKEKKSAIQIFTNYKASYTAARISNIEVMGVVV